MKNKLNAALVIVAISLAILGCSSRSQNSDKVTMQNFLKLRNGMTYPQVEGILGQGEMASDTQIGNTRDTTYTWKGGFMQSVSCSFENDKLVSKFQLGLDDK